MPRHDAPRTVGVTDASMTDDGAGVGHSDGASNGGLLGEAGDGKRVCVEEGNCVCAGTSGVSHAGQVGHTAAASGLVGELEAGLLVGDV